MIKSVLFKNFKFSLGIAILVLTASFANAQTYTTKADGLWSSAATWVGGVVPSRTVAASVTINIKHTVTYDVSGDLDISGTLNVNGDTLRYASNSTRNLIVEATGTLNVSNGAIVQDISKSGTFNDKGGRVIFNASYLMIDGDITSQAGSKRTFNNSSVYCNGNFVTNGTSASPSVDTVLLSDLNVGTSTISGDLNIQDNTTQYVSFASYYVSHTMHVTANGHVITLPLTNYGVDILKVTQDFNNDGDWQAPVNNYCVGHNIGGPNAALVDYTKPMDCNATASVAVDTSSYIPELVFSNPKLVSGTALKPGAVYKFSNVASGIDANITIVAFSDPKGMTMQSFDLTGSGWDKAFQPQFGYAGYCPTNGNWYADFKLDFYKAGTTTPLKVQQFSVSALDVDGDGYSVAEYVQMNGATTAAYSNGSTYLKSAPPAVVTCPVCGKASVELKCPICTGLGYILKGKKQTTCATCKGIGQVFAVCLHPWTGSDILAQSSIDNAAGIDTSAVANMVTYQMNNVSSFTFRYGATSKASDYGGGMRLNSMWFKAFNMSTPISMTMLPVHLNTFNATLSNKDVVLNWSASTEEQLSHYVLQRSTDGQHYNDIATIFAQNKKASGTASYSYKDANVASETGKLFYRLRMVDNAQEADYSQAKFIRLEKETNELAISLFPNPVKDQLMVSLPATWQGKAVKLELFSSNGSSVKNILIGNAAQTESIDVHQLTTGFYLLKATCKNETAQQRVIKN